MGDDPPHVPHRLRQGEKTTKAPINGNPEQEPNSADGEGY